MRNLLLAVSKDVVCGEYLKENKILYRALRNNFNQAQSGYRQLMESPDTMLDEDIFENNANNWRALAEACAACLEKNSKDIEVFCWFISAQLFSADPLHNLRDGLQIFVQIINTHWQDLHPKPPVEKLKSDDEAEWNKEWADIKVKPLWQLAGESEGSGLLAMPLSNLPLIGPINYTQFFSAERSGSLAVLKDQAKKIFHSNSSGIEEKILTIESIRSEFVQLEKSINEHCSQVQASTISFRFILKVIDNLLNTMKFLLSDCFATWPSAVVEQNSELAVSTADVDDQEQDATKAQSLEQVSTGERVVLSVELELYHRDQAFAQLRIIADFFRRTEPHSPIYMLLERSIRWGYMSLPQLLEEMVGGDEQVMQHINQLAGLESVEKTTIPKATMSSAELEIHKSYKAEQSITGAMNTQKPANNSQKREDKEEVSEVTKKAEFEW